MTCRHQSPPRCRENLEEEGLGSPDLHPPHHSVEGQGAPGPHWLVEGVARQMVVAWEAGSCSLQLQSPVGVGQGEGECRLGWYGQVQGCWLWGAVEGEEGHPERRQEAPWEEEEEGPEQSWRRHHPPSETGAVVGPPPAEW